MTHFRKDEFKKNRKHIPKRTKDENHVVEKRNEKAEFR